MADEQEGVSTRQLLAAFFAVVVLCAVFFSLGFFLGHQERSPASTLATEQVPSSSSDAPPAVNPPDQAASSGSAESPAASASNDQGTTAASPVASATRGAAAGSGTAESPAPAAPREEQVISPASQPTTAQKVALQTTAPAAPVPSVPRRVPPGPLVQVAALTNQQDANDMLGVLQSRGFTALVLTPQQARATDNLFRVVTGPYKTRAEAEAARGKLAAAGFKPFIRP